MGIVKTTEERPVVIDVITAVCDGCGATHEIHASPFPSADEFDRGVSKGWVTMVHGDGVSGSAVRLSADVNGRLTHYVFCIECMGRVREAIAALPSFAERARE